MKPLKLKTGIIALTIGVLFAGCSDNDGPTPDPDESQESKYVLITMSDNVNTKPGYATAFDELPSGNVINNGNNSLQGLGFGGWRPYGNWLFKMFSTDANALGIERLEVNADGKVTPGQFIAGDNTTNGTGNFVIVDETKGYYWDGASPLKIQVFNPTTLSRTGDIDLAEAVNERGADEPEILYRAIGQKFLSVKNGKLFANITYATSDGTQKGFWDDFYPDVYIAVIDIATSKHEKTIKIKDTGAITYINDNNMYDFDTNGDLYIVTQGVHPRGTGGKSKIVRIKANETDIDSDWSLDMDAITGEGPRKFVSVFAKDGKIITLIPNASLTGGPTGNINFEDVWEYFSIDIASKERTKIGGVPVVTNPGAAFCAIEIDNKILLRVNTKDGSSNGYFEYNPSTNSATELFKVTSGGSVSGLHKVKVGN
ncbi:hypothetical protein [Sphingobacterium arenae]|uniref:DUF4374 domain-containing protein n=1 Tax=Sphingobacterium arenae TaxID=1280598 RepID=A0ABR7Y1J3_9SPHI|nr:hypothetical protein [Sphingobacterium arenae]MBD1425168.1 hypothetical protein [Sphingobacterium arenae]